MARHAAGRLTATKRRILYREITDSTVIQLEAGCVPWDQSWNTGPGAAAVAMPRNAATARVYFGINVMLLWAAGIEAG